MNEKDLDRKMETGPEKRERSPQRQRQTAQQLGRLALRGAAAKDRNGRDIGKTAPGRDRKR